MSISTIKQYDFDTIHDRKNTSSAKWSKRLTDDGQYIPINEGDISFWVADMDFPTPPEVLDALRKRIEHPFFGYTTPAEALNNIIVARMKDLYGWDIQAEWILYNPGMVMLLRTVTEALTEIDSAILMDTPVYGPFLSRPKYYQRVVQKVPMIRVDTPHTFHYEIDFEAFEQAITSQTEMYHLCSPHNPSGKSFTRDELQRLAEICLKHEVIIVSDEIHCDLMLGDTQHIPIASLSPEIANNTITMIAGTKTFNMAGLACSVAIVPDASKREKINNHMYGLGSHVSTLAYEALLAGYRDCDNWLRQVRDYIKKNRDYLLDYVRENLPMIKTTIPDATYLVWMDFSAIEIPDEYSSISDYLVREAGVVLEPGSFFGENLESYVRINIACPRALLTQALDRMTDAVNAL